MMKPWTRMDWGDMCLQYWLDDEKRVGCSIYPAGKIPQLTEHRKNIKQEACIVPLVDVFGGEFSADILDPLVQLKVRGDGGAGRFGAGTTMRNSESSYRLKLVCQDCVEEEDSIIVKTTLKDDRGLRVIHHAKRDCPSSPYVRIWTEVFNARSETITLDMLR